MRKLFGKVFLPHTILPLCLTACSMLCSYQAAKLLQFLFGFHNPYDLTLPFDVQTPFVPGWSWVYIASYIFWIYMYILAARDSAKAACKLAVADFVGKMICFVFFLAFPTTNVRPIVEGTGLTAILMRTIFRFDTPTNLFPSIHCFVAWLGMRSILAAQNLKHKKVHCVISVLGTLLVFASTLFTKQHVVLDVLGGIAVVEIGLLVARFSPLTDLLLKWNEKFLQTKFGRFFENFLNPTC